MNEAPGAQPEPGPQEARDHESEEQIERDGP